MLTKLILLLKTIYQFILGHIIINNYINNKCIYFNKYFYSEISIIAINYCLDEAVANKINANTTVNVQGVNINVPSNVLNNVGLGGLF